MAYISPSIFAADRNHLNTELDKIRESGAQFLHFDVMDGKFVPLLGLDVSLIEIIQSHLTLPIDVHLMVLDVDGMIPAFIQAGVHSIVFHVENRSEQLIHNALQLIKQQGIRCGLAISPNTDIELLSAHLDNVDEILVMSTTPGRPNTVFLDTTYDRIRQIRKMVDETGREIIISVDGGVDGRLALKCIEAGADKIVLGRAFFANSQPKELVSSIIN